MLIIALVRARRRLCRHAHFVNLCVRQKANRFVIGDRVVQKANVRGDKVDGENALGGGADRLATPVRDEHGGGIPPALNRQIGKANRVRKFLKLRAEISEVEGD